MTRDDELDLLSLDTQRQLADCLVTFTHPRPAGELDPVTMTRTVPEPAVSEDVPAVVDDDEPSAGAGGRKRRRAWIVRIADLVQIPAAEDTAEQDTDGSEWRVLSSQRTNDGREVRVVGERIG